MSFYGMSCILSLSDVFSGWDSSNAFLTEMSQKLRFLLNIISGGTRLICSHIGSNKFDNVNVVSENFLHCMDTVFLVILIRNPRKLQNYELSSFSSIFHQQILASSDDFLINHDFYFNLYYSVRKSVPFQHIYFYINFIYLFTGLHILVLYNELYLLWQCSSCSLVTNSLIIHWSGKVFPPSYLKYIFTRYRIQYWEYISEL